MNYLIPEIPTKEECDKNINKIISNVAKDVLIDKT